MKRFLWVPLAALVCLVPFPVLAAPPPVLADFGWLSGRWVDDSGGNLSEEVWNAPSGDAMQGMWRYVVGGKAQIYEILTISEEDGGLVMRIRHFDPKLVAREEKTAPVALRLVSSTSQSGVFEGPEAGGSGLVKVTYVLMADGMLKVTLEKAGRKEGFSFRRASK